jgi:Ser/Thr protein kinase RdoA (MazF antagonist)
MLTGTPARALAALGVRSSHTTVLKDVPLENGSWLVDTPAGTRLVLRRYHAWTGQQDLAYEHAVLRHLASTGWVVPGPVGEAIQLDGRWYCLTLYVPGRPAARETPSQRRRRGRDLAQLHLSLRGLGRQTGQRPGWRALHAGVTMHTGIDWAAALRGLMAVSPRLGSWAAAAAAETRGALAAIGAEQLPVMVVHGDFAEWNVHYEHGRLAGVIDFGLTHLDSRPFELAIARTYRAPEVTGAYRAELAQAGWPLSPLEEAAIEPVYRAFRVDMAAWQLDRGHRTGQYDLAMIERQLAMTGTAPA